MPKKKPLDELRTDLHLSRYGLGGLLECTERDIKEAERGDPEAEAAIRPVLEALVSAADETVPAASEALRKRREAITDRKARYAAKMRGTPAEPWRGGDAS